MAAPDAIDMHHAAALTAGAVMLPEPDDSFCANCWDVAEVTGEVAEDCRAFVNCFLALKLFIGHAHRDKERAQREKQGTPDGGVSGRFFWRAPTQASCRYLCCLYRPGIARRRSAVIAVALIDRVATRTWRACAASALVTTPTILPHRLSRPAPARMLRR